MNKLRSAFTLLELLIVIAIIAILVSIAAPIYKKASAKRPVQQNNPSAYQQGHDYSKD